MVSGKPGGKHLTKGFVLFRAVCGGLTLCTMAQLQEVSRRLLCGWEDVYKVTKATSILAL